MATTTLDNLISESGRRTGIGAAAEPLTRELLRFMIGGPGGLSAFLDRFRSAGLGSEVASFLGGRNEAPLTATTVDTVIGQTTVAGMAKRAGVEPAAASTALGFEIPKLIGMLTPDGKVPNALPSEIQSFVGRPDQVGPLAMAAIREEEVQVAPAAMATIREPAKANLTWLWGLLALAVLALLLWMLLGRNTAPVPTAQVAPAPVVAAPAAPAAPVTETLSAITQDLNRNVLNFATASAVLPDGSAGPLQSAADRIKTLPAGTRIEVGGHTDNTGSPPANMGLSQRRADSVRDALVKDGVDASMLTTKGYGDTKPIASNDTPDGRLQNRRTEFTVAGAETTTTTTNANP